MRFIKEKGKRYIALLIVCTLMMGLFPMGVYAVDPSGLQTSGEATGYTLGGESVVIDPNLTIGDIAAANISEASILIRNLKTGDQLHYVNANGITGTYNATNGILSLVGVATVANYQTALRSIEFSTTSAVTSRTIDFVLGSGLYFEGTGHFYEYVSTGVTKISWQDAKTQAEGRSFYGRVGYLVTITSSIENAFVLDKAQGIGWIGARDINRNVDTGNFITGGLVNGDWRWVTGPEGTANGGQGLKFYSGYAGYSPLPVANGYNNWASGEPNSSMYSPGGAEWVSHMFGKTPPVWAPASAAGKWNDFHPTAESVYGYIVEYGGMASDTLINIQASKDIAISDTQFFTVTFKDHDGTVLKVEPVEQGSAASAPADPVRTGYTFTGWDTAFTNITGDLTVTAQYEINSYNLTVNYTMADGSTSPASHTGIVDYNLTYNVNSPAVIGYTAETATVTGTMGTVDVTEEVAYSANTDTAYTVKHYQEELEGTYTLANTDNLTGTTNTSATASAKTYSGFSENMAHVDRFVSGNVSGDGTTTLELYYNRNEYTISYDSNGGSAVESVTANFGTMVTQPSDPTRSGYRFRGWYEDEEFTIAFVFDTFIVEDKTIYASWSRISSGSSSGSTPQSPTNTIVIVNDMPASAGTETKSIEDGKTTTLVLLNNEVIQKNIYDAINNNTSGETNLIQVQVSANNSENAIVELTGDIVKKLEENSFNVSVKNNDIEYIIPAKEFSISKVAEALNIQEKDLKEIMVEVRITKLDEKAVETYNKVAKAKGAELIFPPLTFELIAKTTQIDGTTEEVKISNFSNYVERVMEIPAGVDQSKITTGIVFNSNGTYSHVPTSVNNKDGKLYARINSLTNSTYSVIWNPITVKSVENHWAKDVVNDMASRLVIKNPESFMPDKKITRGEFAEYITKAIGIFRLGAVNTQKFLDVEVTHELAYAIEIASEFGIISGYPDGSFKPDAQISREEAMAMYSRAMTIVGLEEVDNGRINNYMDKDLVASWAYNAVKKTVSAGVFNGKTAETINPKDTFTFAEAATAIRNLLVAKGLINE